MINYLLCAERGLVRTDYSSNITTTSQTSRSKHAKKFEGQGRHHQARLTSPAGKGLQDTR